MFDAVLVLVITVLTFIVAGEYDILEKIVEMSHKYEHFELDEIITASVVLLICLLVFSARRLLELAKARKELKKTNEDLTKALAEVKILRGIIPICSFCKKIRDDEGFWQQVDVYVQHHSEAAFSHSICPECIKKECPDYEEESST